MQSAELRFDLDRLALVERGEGQPPRPGGADIHCAQRRPLAKSERYGIAREAVRHGDDKRIVRIQHGGAIFRQAGNHLRSEEHTSELQSLMRSSYAVFCLKKKNKETTRK